ncbi:MAG: hypothetical protein CMO64_00070 [Verrucomicrobiales bacterium]|nr:hypothetical protein [Verrucomicrobiales bacterium]
MQRKEPRCIMKTDTSTSTSAQPAKQPSGLLTKQQVADALHVTERTISKWQSRGWLQFIAVGGRRLYPWPECRDALIRDFGQNIR